MLAGAVVTVPDPLPSLHPADPAERGWITAGGSIAQVTTHRWRTGRRVGGGFTGRRNSHPPTVRRSDEQRVTTALRHAEIHEAGSLVPELDAQWIEGCRERGSPRPGHRLVRRLEAVVGGQDEGDVGGDPQPVELLE